MMNSSDASFSMIRKRRRLSFVQKSPYVACMEEQVPLLCTVCGEPAVGYNFDALTCASCKVFFRRTALDPVARLRQCLSVATGNGQCNVTGPENRKACPMCRFSRCLQVGMKPELITPFEKLVLRSNYHGKRLPKVNNRSRTSMLQTSVSTVTNLLSHSVAPATEVEHQHIDLNMSHMGVDDATSSLLAIDVQDLEQLFKEEYETKNSSPPADGLFPSVTCPNLLRPLDEAAAEECILFRDSVAAFFENEELLLENMFQEYHHMIHQAAGNIFVAVPEHEMARFHPIPADMESSYNCNELVVRRIISALKKAPQFNLLTRETQIQLLKRGLNGMVLMLVALRYDPNSRTYSIAYEASGQLHSFTMDYEALLRRLLENHKPCSEKSMSPDGGCCAFHLSSRHMSQLRMKYHLIPVTLGDYPSSTCSSRDSNATPKPNIKVETSSEQEDPEKDEVIKCLSVIHFIMTQTQHYTDSDPLLTVALSLLWLFQHYEDPSTASGSSSEQQPKGMNSGGLHRTSDVHIIRRTCQELTWFITRYAKLHWSAKLGAPLPRQRSQPSASGSRSFAEVLMEERIRNLWNVFEVIQSMDNLHMASRKFLRRNLLTPLMQELVPSS